jgi:HD-GYP domain-containing protein (c-di-GMP phosphodiesterase class II)
MSGEVITSSQILRDLLPGVRHHHEHWDGSGYPDGLRGEQIPLEARIIAIADAYDAMCHAHAYKEALTSAEALAEIQRCAGTQFDPHLAPIASQAIEQFEAHHAHHQAA